MREQLIKMAEEAIHQKKYGLAIDLIQALQAIDRYESDILPLNG